MMDYLWIIYGLSMVYLWIIYGLSMDYLWFMMMDESAKHEDWPGLAHGVWTKWGIWIDESTSTGYQLKFSHDHAGATWHRGVYQWKNMKHTYSPTADQHMRIWPMFFIDHKEKHLNRIILLLKKSETWAKKSQGASPNDAGSTRVQWCHPAYGFNYSLKSKSTSLKASFFGGLIVSWARVTWESVFFLLT